MIEASNTVLLETPGAAAAQRLSAPREAQPLAPTAPDVALGAIASHRGPVLSDFDETLFLRNSTECFLDSAWPGALALLLLRLLDLLKPWRFGGGEATRDNWRVGTVLLLMPWTWLNWKRRVAGLAALHTNRPLVNALRAGHSGERIIVSIGFREIIEPLARAMGVSNMRLVACRVFHGQDRAAGKLALALAQLGELVLNPALAVSDSPDDLPLLQRCRSGLLVSWPEARFIPALRDAYLPGQYISRVKHPGQRYILRAVLQEDFALWLLASVAIAPDPVWHSLGLALLLLSFWAIYEQGYADNDRCGLTYEKDPKLSAEFFADPMPPRTVEPWLWAAGAGTLALWALRHPVYPETGDYLRWGLMLASTHALFRLYNRIDKSSRVWLYSGLQFARTAAFVAVVAVPPVGVAALGAHVFARWAPYYFYRQGGHRWISETFHLTRLMLFCWLALLVGMAEGADSVLNWTGGALLAWNLYRARRELATAWHSARRIDGPVPEGPASPGSSAP